MNIETTDNKWGWSTHRTLDPTGSFTIKVVVKRDISNKQPDPHSPPAPPPNPNEEEDENGERELADFLEKQEGAISQVIRWQEKFFSPKEVQLCRSGALLSENVSLSHKYDDQIRKLIQNDPNYSGSEIFTKTGDDHYVDPSEIDTPFFGQIGTRKPTELAEAVLHKVGNKEMIEVIGKSYDSMHVFTSIKINNGEIFEQLLAIIRVYPGGRIDVRPSFSNKKNPRIHYRFFTPSKELITYSIDVIENYSQEESPFERTLLSNIKRRRAIFEAAQMDCKLAQPPEPSNSIRMFYRGEISQVILEDSIGIAVEYQLKLPNKWKIEEKNQILESCSQFSLCNDEGISNINLPIDFVATCETQIAPTLFLTLHSFTSDGARIVEGYGTCSLPMTLGTHNLEVNVWRVRGKISEELRLIFLNSGLEQQSLLDLTDNNEELNDAFPDNTNIILNKFGLRTIGTGKVIIKMNLAMQSSLFGKRINQNIQGQVSALGTYPSRMSVIAGRFSEQRK